MANIPIRDIPGAVVASPDPSNLIPMDNGSLMQKTTIANAVNTVLPLASQATAEAGLNNSDRMSSLRTKQAIDAQAPVIVNTAITALNLGTMSQEEASDYTPTAGLAAVALSNDYDDLDNLPALGTMSQEAASDYTKTSGLAAVALSNSYADLSSLPTLGTAAATDASDYATSAQGALADTAVQPGAIGDTVQAHNGFLDGLSAMTPGSSGQFIAFDSNGDPVAVAAPAPPIVANTMLVDNAAGTARENKTFEDVRSLLRVPEASVNLARKTNVAVHGSFAQGWTGWAARGGSDTFLLMNIEEAPTGDVGRYFSGAKLQLSATAAGKSLFASPPRPVRIDPTQAYSVGAAVTGAMTATIQVHCYDENMTKLGTLSFSVTAPSAGTGDGISGYFFRSINAQGGASPAWPAGTVAAVPQVGYTSTGAQSLSVWALWLIPQSEYPGNVATTSMANSGGGTHEAVSDDTHFYVINHGFNWLVKFDSDLKYVSHIPIGDYPHDLVSIGNDVWVINQTAADLRRISKTSFTITNTYPLPSGKNGYGLATDGTRLWCGAGSTAQTPAIYEVNTTTGAMTLLSSDIDGGGANIPLRYMDGSLWSIRQTPSEVKRINPTSGATIATISADVGGIYGLGSGEGFIFACGRYGVAQVDPATNTVVNRYFFRETAIGHSNVEVANGRAYACTATGVMIIDIARQSQSEIVIDGGNNKWARALPGGDVVVGTYGAPWLFVLSER